MKIKHKIGFITLVTIIDIFVIVFVVMNNDNTKIQNDVNKKTLAHIIESENTEINNEIIEEQNNQEEIIEKNEEDSVNNNDLIETSPENKIQEETVVPEENNVSYDEMSIEERIDALNNGTLTLQYSNLYTESNDRLTKSKGAIYFNGHKETYYSEQVLPGTSLNIPGRHVADDGTVRDGDGYICVAANPSYMPKGSILITSLGPAKVYDTGCLSGTIDIYVNWQ